MPKSVFRTGKDGLGRPSYFVFLQRRGLVIYCLLFVSSWNTTTCAVKLHALVARGDGETADESPDDFLDTSLSVARADFEFVVGGL